MIKNNRGSVSILGIYLCYLLLFLTILIKAMLVENIYYYKDNNKGYHLFLIENAIITNIYKDHNKINYNSKRIKYNSTMKIVNNDYIFKINLIIDNDIYLYEVKYDYICNQVLEFNNITPNNSF